MALELEVWQAPIVDNEGNIQPGAQVTVFNSDDTIATIYDDLDRTPRSNPFNVGSDALARFYAEPGRYRVQAQVGSDIAVYDDIDLSQKALRDDLADPESEAIFGGRPVKDVSSLGDDLAQEGSEVLISGVEAKEFARLNQLPIAGTFESGFTITEAGQFAIFKGADADGSYLFRWDGELPKEVPPSSTPDGTGGEGVGAWVDVGQAALRSDLSAQFGAGRIQNNTIALNSIKELADIPAGLRRTDLQYSNASFWPELNLGGGLFAWNPERPKSDHNGGTAVDPDKLSDLGNAGDADPFGDYFVADGTENGCFELIDADSKTLTPFHYGLPRQSEDLDLTTPLQSLLGHAQFAFPDDFEASCLRLFAQDNTRGYFGKAKLTMLSGTHPQTSIVTFDANVENVTYWGGVLDGNRGNIVTDGSPTPGHLWSGDGGMHCIQLASGKNIYWYGPTCLNADTDGIYVRASGAGGVLDNVHIFDPTCDNCSRQGLSDAGSGGAGGVDVYNGKFLNTNGKAPEAGIDIEPLDSDKFSDLRLHGKTLCSGNAGNGFLIDPNSGAERSRFSFDELILTGNEGTAGIRMTGSDECEAYGNKLITDSWLNFGGSNLRKFVCKYVECQIFSISGTSGDYLLDLNIDRLICGMGYSQTFSGPLRLTGNKRGVINHVTCINENEGDQARAGHIHGGGVKINRMDYDCPRGIYLEQDGNGTEVNIFVDKPQLAENCRIETGATNFKVTVNKSVTDGQRPVYLRGDGNDVNVVWPGGGTSLTCEGNNNTITVRLPGAVSTPVNFTSPAENNLITASYLGTAPIIDNGTGNEVSGCFPVSRNTG